MDTSYRMHNCLLSIPICFKFVMLLCLGRKAFPGLTNLWWIQVRGMTGIACDDWNEVCPYIMLQWGLNTLGGVMQV